MIEYSINPSSENDMRHSFKHITSKIGKVPYYANKSENCVLFHADCINALDAIPLNTV
ncbi:MAG: hypothetical protein HQL27_05600 [Candidatus Omnitrophica bacterium]|nr:hypothetical protein [Candidatus Omnitrophota bacterium]